MIAAVIIGLLTAWYLGVRAGVVAAVVSALALVVAMVVPGATWTVYLLLGGYVVMLYALGGRLTGRSGGAVGEWGQQAARWTAKLKSLWPG